jgi:hypothetical protein
VTSRVNFAQLPVPPIQARRGLRVLWLVNQSISHFAALGRNAWYGEAGVCLFSWSMTRSSCFAPGKARPARC